MIDHFEKPVNTFKQEEPLLLMSGLCNTPQGAINPPFVSREAIYIEMVSLYIEGIYCSLEPRNYCTRRGSAWFKARYTVHVFSIVDRPKFSCTDMEFLVVWLARPFPLFLFTCSFANKNSSISKRRWRKLASGRCPLLGG